MSGSVDLIVPNATSHLVDQSERALMRDILFFLVYEQFVEALEEQFSLNVVNLVAWVPT